MSTYYCQSGIYTELFRSLKGTFVITGIEIENFYSVRQAQTIDLRVAENAPDPPGRFGRVCQGSPDRAPKVVALFGANAAGKSTVLRALGFIAWFVQSSFQLPPDSTQPCESFHDREAGQLRTRLAIHFSSVADFTDPDTEGCAKYVYEVSFRNEFGKPKAVLAESLRRWPSTGGKPVRVFERDQDGQVLSGKTFGLTGYKQVISKVRANASLVATLAQFDHKPSLFLQSVARSVQSNILIEKVEYAEDFIVRFYAENPQMLRSLNREIERIDLGIKSVTIDAGNGGPVARFEHEGLDRLMPMHLESHGTRMFIRIFPVLMQTLTTGGVAVIDELNMAIHPIVLPEILRWFYDPERNKKNAQLWMSCHNPALLDDLIKEEVYFCEKDSRGRTRIYGLQDIQSVRRSDNFYSKYLGGVYGAVPQLG